MTSRAFIIRMVALLQNGAIFIPCWVVPDSVQVWVDTGSGAKLVRPEINFNNRLR